MRLCVLLLSFLLTGVALAAGDLDRGKQSYGVCAGCHGADATGNQAMQAPSLVNLDVVYLERQLMNFKSGARGGAGASAAAAQMKAMSATLTDAAVADVAAYIDSLPDLPTKATVEGDYAGGQSQYNMICGACHGARAEGNASLEAPALAGVDDWYLLAQLEAFRTGVRGTHSDDRLGAQMRSMAAVLQTEQAAKDVVVYIQSLNPQLQSQ